MKILISLALFVLGVYLATRVLAALHGVIDLWYTIRTRWPQVLRGLLVWCGGTAGIVLALGEEYHSAFLWGLAAYVTFYLGAAVFLHVGLRLFIRRQADGQQT